VQFLRRGTSEKCPVLGRARLWRKVCFSPFRGLWGKAPSVQCPSEKLQLSMDTVDYSKQNATKVIKKTETQNLSRNELTFGHEQDVLCVTKGLEWKAISTFH
jgi:hypothetical protein